MNEIVPKRRGAVEPTIFAVVGIAILVGLGAWQLDRLKWKEELIAKVTARLAGPPASGLPARDRWPQLSQDDLEFRRVIVPVEFVPNEEALVYTSGSAFRPDVSGPGYWVFTPARLPGGSTIIVNRGFIPFDKRDPSTRRDSMPPRGTIDITGMMRWPEQRGLFTPADDPKANVWYVRDARAIAQAKEWGPTAPFFVDMEAPNPPSGTPRAGPHVVKLTNNHLQYAVTWFGLALVLLGVYVAWLRSRRRPR